MDQAEEVEMVDRTRMLTGDAVLANIETRMVMYGTITFWTDNRSKAMVIVKNPVTGNEDRITVTAPGPWWVIQHQMQIIEEQFTGSPMLEVQRTKTVTDCATCGGVGGAYDKDGNWIECPECGR